jgi:hypothetical protein
MPFSFQVGDLRLISEVIFELASFFVRRIGRRRVNYANVAGPFGWMNLGLLENVPAGSAGFAWSQRRN